MDLLPNIAQATTDLIDTHLSMNRPIRFTVTTSSMEPLLRKGDQVLAVPAEDRDLQIGDLVLIKAPQVYLVHRLIAQSFQDGVKSWLTKGDNSYSGDRGWSKGEICAIIKNVQRDAMVISLGATNIRKASLLLAMISLSEWQVFRLPPSFFRRVALALVYRIMWMGSWLVSQLAKKVIV